MVKQGTVEFTPFKPNPEMYRYIDKYRYGSSAKLKGLHLITDENYHDALIYMTVEGGEKVFAVWGSIKKKRVTAQR